MVTIARWPYTVSVSSDMLKQHTEHPWLLPTFTLIGTWVRSFILFKKLAMSKLIRFTDSAAVYWWYKWTGDFKYWSIATTVISTSGIQHYEKKKFGSCCSIQLPHLITVYHVIIACWRRGLTSVVSISHPMKSARVIKYGENQFKLIWEPLLMRKDGVFLPAVSCLVPEIFKL